MTENVVIRVTPEMKQVINAAGTADQWRAWMLQIAHEQNPAIIRDAQNAELNLQGARIYDTQKEG